MTTGFFNRRYEGPVSSTDHFINVLNTLYFK